VVDLVEAGRSVADVARDLGTGQQSISTWAPQDRIDRGLVPGLTNGEKAELATAKRRIAELETEFTRCGGRSSSWERWCPQQAVPGGQGDGRRRHPGPGGLLGGGRVGVRLRRLAVTVAVGALRHT
jgi:transposase